MPAAAPLDDETLAAAVTAAVDATDRLTDPGDRVRALTGLLAQLQEQVVAVAAARDRALTQLLARTPRPSNRALSVELGISRQRVDQLARHACMAARRSDQP